MGLCMRERAAQRRSGGEPGSMQTVRYYDLCSTGQVPVSSSPCKARKMCN